ncbi:TPA: hypothetical protein H2C21_000924 [Salmonella enterica]|nr:hypothetical protein [Salmonella enterica]
MKGINRLKILQDAIDRNLHPGQAAEMLGFPQYMFLNMVHNLFISGHGVT